VENMAFYKVIILIQKAIFTVPFLILINFTYRVQSKYFYIFQTRIFNKGFTFGLTCILLIRNEKIEKQIRSILKSEDTILRIESDIFNSFSKLLI